MCVYVFMCVRACVGLPSDVWRSKSVGCRQVRSVSTLNCFNLEIVVCHGLFLLLCLEACLYVHLTSNF